MNDCGGPSTCVANANTIWKLGTIAASASQIITVNANVLPELAAGAVIPWNTYVTGTGIAQAIEVDVAVPASVKP